MTVKIDGTNGIDTAQLRAPDGDPVAMTVGNDGKIDTPIGIFGFVVTASYIKFPSWMGKLLIQWGGGATVAGVYDFAFPTAFAVAPQFMNCSEATTAFATTGFLACGPLSATNGLVTSSNGAGASSAAQKTVFWIAIGVAP